MLNFVSLWCLLGLINFGILVHNYGRYWLKQPIFFLVALWFSLLLGGLGLFIKLYKSNWRPFLKEE